MYTITNKNNIYFVTIPTERATVETAKKFRDFLVGEIEEKKMTKLVIDFSNVMFIDSSFLSSLVVALKQINLFGGDIKLINLEPPVRLMFELTRLYKVFEIFETEEEAVYNY